MTRVDDLLAAPRGRGLCDAMRSSAGDVFESLDRAVAFAVYWQEPIDGDAPDEELAAQAERVLRSADVGWWRSPLAVGDQWYEGPPGDPPLLDPAGELARWTQAQRDAVHAPEYRDREDVSGTWWSAPVRLPRSTRSLPGRGPVSLRLTEDAPSSRTERRCWPVAPIGEPRVFEVHGPDDWAQLARTYPFDVTDSRAPDWKRATARSGRWVVPDWPSVAGDYDAVHVSTWGWLTTAGRPVAVNGAASLLAGWSPDETYWLSDCLAITGEPVDYVRGEDGWRPAA